VRGEERSSSDGADESGAARELSGEVRKILTTRGPTRRSAFQGDRPNGTTGYRSVADTGRRVRGERVDSQEVAPVDWETGSRGWGGSRTGHRPVEQTGRYAGPESTCYQQGQAAREWESIRERSQCSVDRISPAELSLRPELSPISDWTAPEVDAPASHVEGHRNPSALHEGARVRDEHWASRGVSHGETGQSDMDAVDAWPSERRGARDHGDRGDRGDHGDRGKHGASKDTSHGETGSRHGVDS